MTSLISTALVSRPFVSSCNTTCIVETQYSICKIWNGTRTMKSSLRVYKNVTSSLLSLVELAVVVVCVALKLE